MKKTNRVEFCCHTKMSELQGLNTVKEYIDEAISRSYKAIAITDTNSTQAFFEAQEYINNNNIKDFKIIYGTQLKFKEQKDAYETYDIYIYVKEQKGLKNLYNILSIAYNTLIQGKPVVLKKELDKYRKGLMYAAIGSKSEIYQKINDSNIKEIINYYDFIGIEPNQSDKNANKKIAQLCKETNKIIIGTSECNFINKEDSEYAEILNFYKKSNNLEEGNNKYFHTTEELIKALDYIENAEEIVIENTNKIAEQIENINLVAKKGHYPIIKDSDKIIKENCYNRAYELYGKEIPKEIKERLELEINSILKNHFETIYLICSDLVKKSNELGYEVGSRGAVGNSFVAYLLEITNINPIEYKLPFENFAGKNYDREPDIDLNFSYEIQNKMFEYLQEKFGKDKIIKAGTIGTLADRSIYNCYKEFNSTFELDPDDFDNKKNELLKKLSGIKRCTGEHPGGILIIPEKFDITDFCPTEMGKDGNLKTHLDYHTILNNSGLYKFDILGHDDPTILHELEKISNISSRNIDLNDKETISLFLHSNDKDYNNSIRGIPEFGNKFIRGMVEKVKPQNFNDLVCISALAHGTNTWTYNAETLIKNEGKKIEETISNRADLFNYLVEKGIDKEISYDITNFVKMGKAERGRSLWANIRDRYAVLNEQWAEYRKILEEHNIPEWYIHSAEKIRYMFPKAHAIAYTMNAFKIAWYKVHYPEAFYKIYFKVKSDLNLKDYYNKKQIKTELNRLYDEKEMHDNNSEFDYDIRNNNKINDLEILLEMYNRGILKEKKEIDDDYNLINSRAIADYCRIIKHKFNTEELAVLVYRNNRMSIDEKINKYKDLIKNYPDMEVIECINCKHYDSVKVMIQGEIDRLEKLYKKFIADDNENAIYSWTELNKSTQKWSGIIDLIKNSKKTYKEIQKNIKYYINEYNDTLSYRIIKKFFGKKEKIIYAEYIVVNKQSKLINIAETEADYLDIDNIFLNIPTPFKKGDILISNSSSMKNIGDCGEIFVLDYLCTWRENLKEYLAKGNYDSSDMIGYGYYLYGEDSIKFVRDCKWDYDSFEYYDGELEGNNRIFKDISSFLKNKIGLELFVHAYDFYKAENERRLPDFYTDESLKLAGFTDADILK